MITADLYPLLTEIIDEAYTDGIDKITAARESEDGSILVVGVDGSKQIAVKITDTNIKIRILNPDPISTDSAAFSSFNLHEQMGIRLVELAYIASFAAPKKNSGALKKKTCKAGLSCGGACIAKSKICARELSGKQQRLYKELKKRLKSGDMDAQAGIDALRDEQQGITPKAPATPKETTIAKELKIADRKKAMFANVKDITSSSKASDFAPQDIEDLADSILESGGLFQPLVVKQNGNKYEAIDGGLAYHASVRAREKNLKQGEMVNVFIMEDGESDSPEQNKILKSDKQITKNIDASPKVFAGRDDKAMFVNVRDITSSRPASDFNPKDIEDLAVSILANGGLLQPMILAPKGVNLTNFAEQHEVVSGHLGYHASVRAKELNPKFGEMTNGFTVSPENMSNVIRQIELLNKAKK